MVRIANIGRMVVFLVDFSMIPAVYIRTFAFLACAYMYVYNYISCCRVLCVCVRACLDRHTCGISIFSFCLFSMCSVSAKTHVHMFDESVCFLRELIDGLCFCVFACMRVGADVVCKGVHVL